MKQPLLLDEHEPILHLTVTLDTNWEGEKSHGDMETL